MDLTIYSEILILIHVLLSYIFRDHLIGDIAGTATEVSAGPQVPAPELLLQVRELCQQVMRRLSLQPLQQPADRHLRRNRHEHVYVVFGHMPLHDGHLMLGAYVSYQISRACRHLSCQGRSPILRDPHQMQMDLEYGVRAASIFWHPSRLSSARSLKPSPKGEGFDPPRLRQ